MTKLLPFVFGTVTLECADAKMWNVDDGDNHSNDTFRIFLWIGRIKRLSLIAFMILSVLLYYIPESRSHVRKACCFLIDLIADGLKFTLRATESDYGNKMKFKRRTLLNNHSRRRNAEKNKTNERLSKCQDNMVTRSRGYIHGLDGKYLNHRRNNRRYREMIANDVTLKTCLELAPFLQNQYQQKRDMYSVRLKNENDDQMMIDRTFNHRNDIPYSKEKFIVGYVEDCEPNDSNLSLNYYESSNDRFDRSNVAEVSTYQEEIVGDNQFFTNKNERSMEDLKGDTTIRKRKILGIRQMHGDTIPEISYNESSYTSLEAEADDENSQCGNEIEKGMKFSKKRNIEETTTMSSTSMGGYHSSSSSEILFPTRIRRNRRTFL
ncbi:hypothetical protein M0804_007930 [Polistes exclamans]|nr:hypothetical protein M0804_007930 [Polistes exclamans]